MTRPNFFCDIDSLNTLLGMEFNGEYKDLDLTMDIIELPYYFIFSCDKNTWTVKAFQRGELYSHDDSGIERGSVEVNKESGEGQVKATQELGENMGAFLAACRSLSYFIQENQLEERYEDFNPEEKGFMLYVENDSLKYKVVEGKERPDMMCSTLFGGTVMGRPYMDDFMERSARESMSIEEKIDAAENGDIDCMDELAMLYTNGDEDTDSDPQKAVYWFRKMAEAGNSNGMFNLGLHLAKGHGIERNFEQAAFWMEKAADAGDEDAPNAAKEYKKLAECIVKAEAGDAQAQAELAGGLMKLGGSLDQAGQGNDYTESVRWAQKAIDQGNAEGMWVMALAYHHGRGVAQNMDIAIEYYEQGAELGNAACRHNLGCEYMSGEHVEEDHKKAFELIKSAAEQGYGLAMRDLGRCYQFGKGCMGNMKTAVEWYEKALEVIDDPELEQKTMIFKMMADSDPSWDEDYAGDFDESDDINEDENIDTSGLPDGYMDALGVFADLEEYEEELASQGMLPDAPVNSNGELEFVRVHIKAEAGDEKAIELLARLDAVNHM